MDVAELKEAAVVTWGLTALLYLTTGLDGFRLNFRVGRAVFGQVVGHGLANVVGCGLRHLRCIILVRC